MCVLDITVTRSAKNNDLTVILNMFLIITDENIFLLYYFTPTTYATNDTTIIHPILQSAFPFSTTGSWDLFAIKSAAVFGLVFFQISVDNQIFINIWQNSTAIP